MNCLKESVIALLLLTSGSDAFQPSRLFIVPPPSYLAKPAAASASIVGTNSRLFSSKCDCGTDFTDSSSAYDAILELHGKFQPSDTMLELNMIKARQAYEAHSNRQIELLNKLIAEAKESGAEAATKTDVEQIVGKAFEKVATKTDIEQIVDKKLNTVSLELGFKIVMNCVLGVVGVHRLYPENMVKSLLHSPNAKNFGLAAILLFLATPFKETLKFMKSLHPVNIAGFAMKKFTKTKSKFVGNDKDKKGETS